MKDLISNNIIARKLKETDVYFRYRRYVKREIYNRRIEFVDSIFPKNGVGAELGVLNGHFSQILLDVAKPKKLHLVDPWYFLEPHWEWANGNKSTVRAVRTILKTYKKEIEAGQVLVHVDFDIPVLEAFADDYLDWAYVDSSHQYEHTRQELNILKHKVKNGGIIAGDDYNSDPNHVHHGVLLAVDEFVKENGLELVYANKENLQWAIRNKK
ncbi:class I SAM-dependent methyltransferase [Fulvivirga sedimenti]|uniref:Class I SAM-dependent methyltransferase n=1 Tax=Fulvivirga sedimenti TaxID=2879465 RepID=A0A9X1HMA9_9BACT|nr:class I SAM-dependent methyltransferase [Fulvivirga sedimenti]MCA6074829.1 class I SAM-dependent methyltransferase [Fulvivirga sedimenti]MCA6076006.1 class I SAM-dependent methyltransferase [Fulvivirga sedimenti]MCA6077134.1 class I SAM-dependent methyltransferase [Fulvivirga sedimenti]